MQPVHQLVEEYQLEQVCQLVHRKVVGLLLQQDVELVHQLVEVLLLVRACLQQQQFFVQQELLLDVEQEQQLVGRLVQEHLQVHQQELDDLLGQQRVVVLGFQCF
ncbi:hypothetical protein NA113_22935 [Salmonella sp. NW968]|uniref:hypothetical protein n=1 Tax=Salmonella sp. NW968 TaxID=2948453 RepID=UPI003F277C4F